VESEGFLWKRVYVGDRRKLYSSPLQTPVNNITWSCTADQNKYHLNLHRRPKLTTMDKLTHRKAIHPTHDQPFVPMATGDLMPDAIGYRPWFVQDCCPHFVCTESREKREEYRLRCEASLRDLSSAPLLNRLAELTLQCEWRRERLLQQEPIIMFLMQYTSDAGPIVSSFLQPGKSAEEGKKGDKK